MTLLEVKLHSDGTMTSADGLNIVISKAAFDDMSRAAYGRYFFKDIQAAERSAAVAAFELPEPKTHSEEMERNPEASYEVGLDHGHNELLAEIRRRAEGVT